MQARAAVPQTQRHLLRTVRFHFISMFSFPLASLRCTSFHCGAFFRFVVCARSSPQSNSFSPMHMQHERDERGGRAAEASTRFVQPEQQWSASVIRRCVAHSLPQAERSVPTTRAARIWSPLRLFLSSLTLFPSCGRLRGLFLICSAEQSGAVCTHCAVPHLAAAERWCVSACFACVCVCVMQCLLFSSIRYCLSVLWLYVSPHSFLLFCSLPRFR